MVIHSDCVPYNRIHLLNDAYDRFMVLEIWTEKGNDDVKGGAGGVTVRKADQADFDRF